MLSTAPLPETHGERPFPVADVHRPTRPLALAPRGQEESRGTGASVPALAPVNRPHARPWLSSHSAGGREAGWNSALREAAQERHAA